jgi:hypothetical protein
MMSTCCSKHVEAWNKYIKKESVKLVINQNYVKMHGQQNIKFSAWIMNTFCISSLCGYKSCPSSPTWCDEPILVILPRIQIMDILIVFDVLKWTISMYIYYSKEPGSKPVYNNKQTLCFTRFNH